MLALWTVGILYLLGVLMALGRLKGLFMKQSNQNKQEIELGEARIRHLIKNRPPGNLFVLIMSSELPKGLDQISSNLWKEVLSERPALLVQDWLGPWKYRRVIGFFGFGKTNRRSKITTVEEQIIKRVVTIDRLGVHP